MKRKERSRLRGFVIRLDSAKGLLEEERRKVKHQRYSKAHSNAGIKCAPKREKEASKPQFPQ
jgi:hypothetical protein